MNESFRDPTFAATLRRDALLADRDPNRVQSRAVDEVRVRRLARIAAGAVLVCGGGAIAAVFLAALVTRTTAGGTWWLDAPPAESMPAVLYTTWGLACAVYGLARLGLRVAPASRAEPDADVFAELARLESPRGASAVAALETASVALPLAGLALTAPLAIHALVAWVTTRGEGFHAWMSLSVMLVGHAHLALALCAALFARKLRGTPGVLIAEGTGRAGWRALGVAALVAAVPGIVLLAVPPVLVFVTGALFVPASFAAAGRCVVRERRMLGELDVG